MHPTTITGVLLIVVVALLLFGPSKLPELGRAFGKTLREFKNGAKDLMGDDDDSKNANATRKELPQNEVTVHDAKPAVPAAENKRRDSRKLPD